MRRARIALLLLLAACGAAESDERPVRGARSPAGTRDLRCALDANPAAAGDITAVAVMREAAAQAVGD